MDLMLQVQLWKLFLQAKEAVVLGDDEVSIDPWLTKQQRQYEDALVSQEDFGDEWNEQTSFFSEEEVAIWDKKFKNIAALQEASKQNTLAMAQETLGMLQTNLDSSVNADIAALKKTEAYKKADSERRADMEDKARRKYQGQQTLLFRGNQLSSIAEINF